MGKNDSRANPSWELIKVYADEGITGTSTVKRKQFNQMISSALAGGIDLILTKEVSRFARNTVDTLQYTRDLTANNVRVIIINDNIDTKDKDTEFRLTIMASVAQEESRKTSERVRWGMTRRMEQGKVSVRDIYGYDVSEGILNVNPEEAEVVKQIFFKYVYEKKGTRAIAEELNKSGAYLSKRINKWTKKNVADILSNEKHVGDIEFKSKTDGSDLGRYRPHLYHLFEYLFNSIKVQDPERANRSGFVICAEVCKRLYIVLAFFAYGFGQSNRHF